MTVTRYSPILLAHMDDFVCRVLFESSYYAYDATVQFHVKLHFSYLTDEDSSRYYDCSDIDHLARYIKIWHETEWKCSHYLGNILDDFVSKNLPWMLNLLWGDSRPSSQLFDHIQCCQDLFKSYLVTLQPSSKLRIRGQVLSSKGTQEGDVHTIKTIPAGTRLRHFQGILSQPFSAKEENTIQAHSHNSIIAIGNKTYLLAGPVHFINGAAKHSKEHNTDYSRSRKHVYVRTRQEIKANTSLRVDYGSTDLEF